MKKLIFILCLLFSTTVFAAANPQTITRIRGLDPSLAHVADVGQLTLNFNTTIWGLQVKSGTYFYDTTNSKWRYWEGIQSALTLVALPIAPQVIALQYYHDGTGLHIVQGGLLDGSVIPATEFGTNSRAIVYGWNGASSSPLLVGAVGELQVTDVSTRPGEDSGRDLVKTEKTTIGTYSPAGTLATAVDDTGGGEVGDEVLSAKTILTYPNFVITFINRGGGSGDPLKKCYVFVSPNNSDWEQLVFGGCDGIASGGVCSKQLSSQSYYYVKAECLCNIGDDSTVDAYITANVD